MSDSRNPWLAVPSEPPYVLPCDSEAIRSFNTNHKDGKYQVQDNVLPEPFIGSTTAPVVLLNLNPGFDDRNLKEHAQPEFQAMLRNAYAQRASAFPFYYLDPKCRGLGRQFWEIKLKHLLKMFERKQVAQSLFCVEYFPYHSGSFHTSLRVSSQGYGFALVRSAIARQAVVVIMRSKGPWVKAIPELENYLQVFTLRNPQNPVLSPANFEGKGFHAVVSAICKARDPTFLTDATCCDK